MKLNCKHCKNLFIQKYFNQKYCSFSCRNKLYTKKSKDRILTYNKVYYKENKQLYSNLCKSYYELHKDELRIKSLERYRRYKRDNPDRLRNINIKATQKYKKTEKGKLVARCDRHRRRNKDIGKIDIKLWLNKLIDFGGKCAYCGSLEKIQIDHIIPISKGGSNHIDNLQPLCLHCNISKGSKIKVEEKVRYSK